MSAAGHVADQEEPPSGNMVSGEIFIFALLGALLVMVALGLVLGDVFEIYHNGSSL